VAGISGISRTRELESMRALTRIGESPRSHGVTALSVVVCGVIPFISLYFVLGNVVASGSAQSVDFGYAYYGAAKRILAGASIYPTDGFRPVSGIIVDYVYPPLIAIVTIPFTALPVNVAVGIFTAMLIGAFVATLFVLGVRDWRCYGVAFVWPPVLEAIQTGNVTIFLCLAAALTWRFRDRPLACGASLGLSLATKILLWPLAIWQLATRRLRAALWSLMVATGVLFVTWSVIGFRGLTEYPGLLRRLSDVMDERAYSVYALGVDVGISPDVARVLGLALALALLSAVVVLGRRGDDRRAFILAIAATIACSPVVWLHYFVLLVVVVALVEPQLGPLWFIGFPMQAVVSTGLYNGSTFQTASMLVLAAVTIVLALRPPAWKPWSRLAPTSSPVAGSP
jgi:hypothetical protein